MKPTKITGNSFKRRRPQETA